MLWKNFSIDIRKLIIVDVVIVVMVVEIVKIVVEIFEVMLVVTEIAVLFGLPAILLWQPHLHHYPQFIPTIF